MVDDNQSSLTFVSTFIGPDQTKGSTLLGLYEAQENEQEGDTLSSLEQLFRRDSDLVKTEIKKFQDARSKEPAHAQNVKKFDTCMKELEDKAIGFFSNLFSGQSGSFWSKSSSAKPEENNAAAAAEHQSSRRKPS